MRLALFSIWIAALLAVWPARAQAEPHSPIAHVTVQRDAGVWSADYRMAHSAPVWVFQRSALSREQRQPWRPQQWIIETPGVVLERIGAHDLIRRTDGAPLRELRIRMTPAAVDLEADYDPALLFTGGAVALFTGHFDVFPMPSVEAVEALPADLNGVELADAGPVEIVWRDTGGRVLHQGRRHDAATTQGLGAYVLFGDAGVVEGDGVTTVIDAGLPEWIGGEIQAFAPRLFDHYARRLGPKADDTPMIMVSWNGPTSGVRSMGGSVLPNLISMTFEGEGVVAPDPGLMAQARWFIGHEAAHFWLGQVVRYEFARDAWITEGGADLSAVRAQEALQPGYDARGELQKSVNDCIRLSQGRGVAEAAGRGEHRAYYACGAVFALAAEATQRRAEGGDWFDWLRPLIDANRQDGVLTRAEWLAHLTEVSGDPTVVRDIEVLLDQGADDPTAAVESLFRKAGVPFETIEGRLRLL